MNINSRIQKHFKRMSAVFLCRYFSILSSQQVNNRYFYLFFLMQLLYLDLCIGIKPIKYGDGHIIIIFSIMHPAIFAIHLDFCFQSLIHNSNIMSLCLRFLYYYDIFEPWTVFTILNKAIRLDIPPTGVYFFYLY